MDNISNKQHFIGCDVSKSTLDFSLHVPGVKPGEFPHITVSNDKAGFKELAGWFRKLGLRRAEAVVGMEHTGVYGVEIGKWLYSKAITFVMLHPLEVRGFCGRGRAKTDKADSALIAEHTRTNRERLEPSSPEPAEIGTLRQMRVARRGLVKSRAALLCQKASLTDAVALKVLEGAISALAKKIRSLEKEMERYISCCPGIDKNYRLLLTIRGVGPVNALALIVATANFTRFQNARQYAKFASVAPLPCRSGSSIDRGCHVSPMGHSQLKAELTQCAKSAMAHDREIRAYYLRKKAQGKPDGVIYNAIKFKLICRMFAVVRRQTPYVERDTFRC